MTHYLTYVIVLIVVGSGILAYLGWRDWAIRRITHSERGWRSILTFAALVFLSLAGLLFVGYAAHNVAVGGDRNGNATTLLCIRAGNYLSVGAVFLSLGAKGRGRWAALLGGCFFLLLWLAQGISL
jgi:hypothetical protein